MAVLLKSRKKNQAPVLKTSRRRADHPMSEDFTGYAMNRLKSVRDAAVSLPMGRGQTKSGGPIFLPLFELKEALMKKGDRQLIQECDLLVNQVLNLCQSDFSKRPHLQEAIEAQADTLQGLLVAC